MKAAIYARVSTPAQGEEEKASIPYQLERMEKYCQDQGYAIADRYVDIGYSGARSTRPQFQRMLADAKKGNFEVIICWQANRLSRGMYPAAALMEVIEPLGITIESVEERFDMNTFALHAVVGKIEMDNIRLRTKFGREARAKKGLHPGGHIVPFGYTLEDSKLIINEREARWIKHLFEWVDGNKPARQWCAYANTNSFPSRGQGVTPQQVSQWLRNPAFKGEYHWNKTHRSVKRRAAEKDHIIIPCPAIVFPELWDRVQAKLKRNKRWSTGNTKNFYLLRKLLHCKECDKGFVCGTSRDRHYECYGTRSYPHNYQCRRPHRINAGVLEQNVWDEIARRLEKLTNKGDILGHLIEDFEARKGSIEGDLTREKELLDRCGWQRQQMATRERQGYLSPKEAELQYRAIQSEEEQHTEEIKKLETLKDENDPKLLQELIDRSNWVLDQYGAGFSDLSDSKKREFLVQLVDRISIDGKNNVEIRLKLESPELTKAVASLSMHNTT